MAGKSGFFKGVLDSFVEMPEGDAASPKVQPEHHEVPQPPPATHEVITSLIEGISSAKPASPAAAKAAPALSSARIGKLLDKVREHIPQDNAVLKLQAAEDSLAGAITDPSVRRTAALGMLKSTLGISDDTLSAAGKSLSGMIDSYFDDLMKQTDGLLNQEVPGISQKAQGLRDQAETLRQQIQDLQGQIQTLTGQAEDLESQADTKKADYIAFKNEIDAARAAALTQYCVRN